MIYTYLGMIYIHLGMISLSRFCDDHQSRNRGK